MNRAPKSRKNDIVVQEMDGEILIYDLSDNKAFSLNETSALVWELCDGNNSITEISQELSKKLKANANEELVWLALDQLKKEKLIENEEIVSASFEGLSRREVIKKVGFTSMIALPVVLSIAAPKATHAASQAGFCSGMGSVGFVGACTMNSDCGQFVQPPAYNLCCRLANFGARVCIIEATNNGQCDCTNNNA